MKRALVVMTLSAALIGTTLATAQSNSGRGRKQRQTQSQPTTQTPAKGKKMGPQDGSGPIHPPGTGGGTGTGQRRGRR